MKKAGFAIMVGRSNVGKSTLLNSLVGSKVAITTPKPQTTRLPIQGILTTDEGQVVFVDTPGLFKKAKDELTKKLAVHLKDSLKNLDMILYVVDPTREIGDEEREIIRTVEKITKPKILVINKFDLRNKPYLDFYKDLSDQFDATVELSALKGTHVKGLTQEIFKLLPEGEPFYPEHQISNQETKEWLAEIIREKLYLRLRQEVPYSVHVNVEEVEERKNGMLYIKATILTTDDRYQRMIIGKGGRGIKEIGQAVRKELEVVMQRKIFIDLDVQVDPHWVEHFI